MFQYREPLTNNIFVVVELSHLNNHVTIESQIVI